eukprot:10642817-Alexandrium_andersonii.AAC.1
MSASLVGSEMCIRDRRATTARNSAMLRPCTSGSDWVSYVGLGSMGGSVSYTHLTLPTICSV